MLLGIPLKRVFMLSHIPKTRSVSVQIGNENRRVRLTPKRSISGPLMSTPQHPSMVEHIYIMLNVLRDIPVVCRIGSVNAQMPIDCPGNEKMMTKQHIMNDTYFENMLLW